jgi:hypothetical protein
LKLQCRGESRRRIAQVQSLGVTDNIGGIFHLPGADRRL